MRRSARFFVVMAACAATASMSPASHAEPVTELLGTGGPVIPLKNAAMIVQTDVGFRYQAGQQNSHLTITQVGQQLLYADTGTRELRDIPPSCSRQAVPTGIAALCTIPAKFDADTKMFLEVWPRLGNDFVDGSTLSDQFRMWVLADAGFDTVRGGDGDDFVNGAQDDDKVWGGAGNDWIRTGPGSDNSWGDTGNDKLVAGPDSDVVRGGEGNDRVDGGTGNDTLWAEAGQDFALCGDGTDLAYVDVADRTTKCESLAAY